MSSKFPLAMKTASRPSPSKSKKRFRGNLICWDLDDTIGSFKGVSTRLDGSKYGFLKQGLRTGIDDTLLELSEEGITQVITTISPEILALKSVLRSGLAIYFDRIYDGGALGIRTTAGKDYSVVARDYGMGEEEFRSKAIIVGDNLCFDKPSSGTFIWEPEALSYPADITKKTILTLLERGNGDFSAGFDSFLATGGQPTEGAELNIDGFKMRLYRDGNANIANVYFFPEDQKRNLEPIPYL